jgi:hypothetical protein
MNLLAFPDLVLHKIIKFSDISITKQVCKKFYSFLDNGISLRKEEFYQLYEKMRQYNTCMGIVELCIIQYENPRRILYIKCAIKQYKKILFKHKDTHPTLLLYLLYISLDNEAWSIKKINKYFPEDKFMQNAFDFILLLNQVSLRYRIENFMWILMDMLLKRYNYLEYIYCFKVDNYTLEIFKYLTEGFLGRLELHPFIYLNVLDRQNPGILSLVMDNLTQSQMDYSFYLCIFAYGSYNLVHRLLEYSIDNGSSIRIGHISIQKSDILSHAIFQTDAVKHLLMINNITCGRGEKLIDDLCKKSYPENITDDERLYLYYRLIKHADINYEEPSILFEEIDHILDNDENTKKHWMRHIASYIGDLKLFKKYIGPHNSPFTKFDDYEIMGFSKYLTNNNYIITSEDFDFYETFSKFRETL